MQNRPTKLYKAAQVRELDRIAIQELGLSGFELMRRAAAKAFQALIIRWPDATSLAIFCGSGNNSGDGYIVGQLALEQGLRARVYSVVDPETLSGDAQTAYQQYRNAQGRVYRYQSSLTVHADVIIDALLGTGLDRAVTGVYADAIATINKSSAAVLAIDISSGLNADTGIAMGDAVIADYTISFVGLKQGLFTGQAADYCGEIGYASLSIPEAVFDRIPPASVFVTRMAFPRRQRCSHKGNYGHVLIVGGDHGFSGAARLAGEAALRVGTGLVSVATRSAHAAMMNLARPELMCHGVDDAGQLAQLLAKAKVVLIGPGLGQSDWAKSLFKAVIQSQLPLVVDADGLNILASSGLRNNNWVLTPHPGEAARLLDCTTVVIEEDRFQAAATIQTKYGGVAVLKGAGTLIASESAIAVSNTGNPGMASGGMGDVLAGVIVGFLAQGLSLSEAAQQGVYLHGLAADLAVAQQGERGLLASDLMSHLRKLVNQ